MIFKGKTFEEAVDKGLEYFKISREEAKIKLIKEGKNLLGLNVSEYQVEVEPSEPIHIKADGYFKILYKEDGVYLLVCPPMGSGSRVKKEDIIERLEYKKVKDYDENTISEAVSCDEERTIRIAPPQEECKYDATLSVQVTHDAKKAYATLTPPDGGKMITLDEALEVLNKSGVVEGIDRDKLAKMIEEEVYNQPVQIASAVLPVDGKDGYVDLKISLKKDKKPVIREDGSVDFHELNLIENVKAGQVLAILVPPVKGRDGVDVRGNVLKAKEGKPAVLPRGKNTSISGDGTMLIASIDGQVCESGGKLNVHPVYEVKGNVDNTTGNIRFVGKVVVWGSVLTGFEIEADGDVEVHGVVEGATIKSGGNIMIKSGVQGNGKAYLSCKGSLVTKFLENCTAHADGDIVAEAIMHSTVSCKSIVEVKGRKGLIVGGKIAAQKEIRAMTVGSSMATVTHLEVGVDPKLRKDIEECSRELKEEGKTLEQIKQSISLLDKMAKKGGLPANKKVMLAKCLKAKKQLEESIKHKNEKLQTLKTKLETISKGKVKVSGTVWPGVTITIGHSTMFIKDYMEYVTYYREEAEVKFGPYED